MRQRFKWRGLMLLSAFLLGCPALQPIFGDPAPADDSVTVNPSTEQVIDGALKYLAAQQYPDGHWSGDLGTMNDRWPVAMTSYVMMAFLASGNLPESGPYAKQVKQGMQYLLDAVQPDGTFLETDRSHYMYSHGLATMVLSELYGETQDPAIRAKLKLVVLLIVDGQNPEGGWRYQPGSRDADISVTVPQVVALCAAKRAGIHVPQDTIDRAIAYIRRCEVGGGFSYQAGRGAPGFARTAAAMYALQISGIFDDPAIVTSSDFTMFKLRQNPHVEYATYGNYYAAVGHYLLGGERWKNYYDLYSQYLLQNVTEDSGMYHWDSRIDPNARMVGSNWPTAVSATILSLPYGYIPLYQR